MTVMKICGAAVSVAMVAMSVAIGATGPLLAQEPVAGGGDTLRPYTVAPQLQNSAEIAGMLESQYPPDLRDRGITGTVVLLVQVDTEGLVRRSTLWESSGHKEFDDVAASLSRNMRFIPARSPSGPVTVQIMVPVDFKLKQDVPDAPDYIAFDVKPALLNAPEANSVLSTLYPPRLKDSKIGGRTALLVRVGIDGHVQEVRVKESSGYAEFDRAAGLASRVMVFHPAKANGEPVAVWNPVTVTFLPDGGSTLRP